MSRTQWREFSYQSSMTIQLGCRRAEPPGHPGSSPSRTVALPVPGRQAFRICSRAACLARRSGQTRPSSTRCRARKRCLTGFNRSRVVWRCFLFLPQPKADILPIGPSFGQATPPEGTFAAVSAGVAHTCGVRTDGTLTFWGNNDHRQTMPLDGAFTTGADGTFQPCGGKTDELLDCWVGA